MYDSPAATLVTSFIDPITGGHKYFVVPVGNNGWLLLDSTGLRCAPCRTAPCFLLTF